MSAPGLVWRVSGFLEHGRGCGKILTSTWLLRASGVQNMVRGQDAVRSQILKDQLLDYAHLPALHDIRLARN
jgi:hypothetical protein